MKKIHVSAILILLVVMSSCAGLIINFKNSQLMSIQKGMTQQEVKTILGKPNGRVGISRVSFQSRAFGDLC